MKLLFTLLLLLAFNSYAADIGCGRDTDRNGSVDNYCPGSDADFDGYSVAQGDCDDTEWQIFPGTLTEKGCSEGSFRKCAADGSGYTSCKALSSMTYSDIGSGATRLFWIGPSGSTALHAGDSYSNPADYRCIGDTTYNSTCRSDMRNGTNDIPAGTAFLFLAGTYNTSYVEGEEYHQLYLGYGIGTATNPIYLQGDPTGAAEIVIQGTSTSNYRAGIKVYESAYVYIDKMKVSGGYGRGGAIEFYTSDYGKVTRSTVLDVDGNGGSDNLSGISALCGRGTSHGCVIATHNLVEDVYNTSVPTNPNNSCIVFYEGEGAKINYNVCLNTRTGGAGSGIKYKHSQSYTTYEMIGNFVQNTAADCIETGAPHGVIRYNLLLGCGTDNYQDCIQVGNVGGGCYFNDLLVEYNTCEGGNMLNFYPVTDYGPIGDPALTFRKNVSVDNKTVYSCGGSMQCPVNILQYGLDTLYDDVMTAGSNNGKKFSITENCWYNSVSTAFQATVFGTNDAPEKDQGAEYASWSSWAAAGVETGSFNENPSFNAIKNSTSTNCKTFGYLANRTSSAAIRTKSTSGRRVIRR